MTENQLVSVLNAALTADHGCPTCVSGVVRQLAWELPEEDWRTAASRIESLRDREIVIDGLDEAQELSPMD